MPFLKTEKGLRFGFARGLLAGTRWGIAGSVCESPTCGCTVLELGFQPVTDTEGQSPVQHRLTVDIETRGLVDDRPADDPAFASALVAELTPEDWDALDSLFVLLKEGVYADKDLADQDFKFRFDEIEERGLLVVYNDVFPFHDRLHFDVDGQPYAAVDYHCLLAGCRCTEVTISFCPITRTRSKAGPHEAHEEFSIILDVSRRQWRLQTTVSTPVKPVDSIVTTFLDRFGHELLAERRCVLRALYRRNQDKAMGTIERSSEKVGRNDPCPCGSGKKYKKCCGR